jgi:hypothetical protein
MLRNSDGSRVASQHQNRYGRSTFAFSFVLLVHGG